MQEIEYPKRDHLTALTKFHHSGGELTDGMRVILERNYRSELIKGILRSWNIGEVKMDLTGYGKYSESSCVVDVNGKTECWPFSMIYVEL